MFLLTGNPAITIITYWPLSLKKNKVWNLSPFLFLIITFAILATCKCVSDDRFAFTLIKWYAPLVHNHTIKTSLTGLCVRLSTHFQIFFAIFNILNTSDLFFNQLCLIYDCDNFWRSINVECSSSTKYYRTFIMLTHPVSLLREFIQFPQFVYLSF